MRRLFLIWMLVSLGELGAKPISFYEEQTGESGVGELVEATMNFEFVLDGKPKTLRFNGELLGTLEMAEREIAEDLVWQLNTENSIRKYMDPLEVLIVLENGEPRVGVKLVQFFVPPGYRRPSGASLLEPSVEVDRSKLKINKSYIL